VKRWILGISIGSTANRCNRGGVNRYKSFSLEFIFSPRSCITKETFRVLCTSTPVAQFLLYLSTAYMSNFAAIDSTVGEDFLRVTILGRGGICVEVGMSGTKHRTFGVVFRIQKIRKRFA
jgi:hypothetical protein